MRLGEVRQDPRQAQRRGGFQRPQQQRPLRRAVIGDRATGLGEQVAQPFGIGQQPPAGRGQADAAAVADEQRRAEFLFQQPDAGGDVGLHRVQFLRRSADPAGAGHRFEHAQIG